MIHVAWPNKPPMGTPINPAWAAARGLVGCWPMWEGSGDQVYDQSGNGNDGTLNGFDFPRTLTSGWNPGEDGVALRLDGTNDYGQVLDSPSIRTPNALTLWARIKTGEGTNRYILTKPQSGQGSFYFGLGPTGKTANKLSIYLDSVSADWLQGTSDLNDNVLHSVVVTYNGSIIRLFVDGIQENSVAASGAIRVGTAPVQIGTRLLAGWFDGYIEVAGIFSYGFTPAQVMSLHMRPWQPWDYVLPFSVAVAPSGNPWYYYAQQQ